MEKHFYQLAIYENIITVIAIVIIWIWTDSAWSLLLLLNMNNVKTKVVQRKRTEPKRERYVKDESPFAYPSDDN